MSTPVMPVTINCYPQRLQVRQITAVGPVDRVTKSRVIHLFDGSDVVASQVMLAQYTPVVGDYFVLPCEGHPFMVAKAVFGTTYVVGG